MKKKWIYAKSPWGKKWQRVLFVSYWIICFVFLSLSPLSAKVFAQNGTISLRMENVSLVDVMKEITRQTGYDFLYNYEIIKDKAPVSVNVKNTKVDDLLQDLLSPCELSFEVRNQVIVLSPSSNPLAPQVKKMTISGKVTDRQGVALPGVTVLLKGTQVGVSTDSNGAFSLDIPETKNIILVFSFVGMETIEQPYKGEKELKITMKEEAREIDEVVVTGIYERKKESFTGSAATFRGEQLKMVSNQNVLQGLRSLDPAFAILENNQYGSDPNRLPDIEVRGKSSIVGFKETFGEDPNQPLFILDGFETTLQVVMDLNMDRVASLTILKDAASTAIYGSKAANGVIVIETKAPEQGKLQVTYSGNFDVTMADLSDYNLMDAREKLEFEMQARKNEYGNNVTHNADNEIRFNRIKAEVDRGVNTYWLSEPLRIGFNHRHNLYAEGGDDRMRYGLGISYNNTQGVMKQSGKEIMSGNIDLLYRVKRLIFSNKFTIDYRTNQDPIVAFSEYALTNPYYRKIDENGEIQKWLEYRQYTETSGSLVVDETPVGNPLWNASLNNFDKRKNIQLRNNFILEWSILDNLKLRGRLGVTQNNGEREKFLSPEHTSFEDKDKLEKGSYENTHTDNFSYEGDLTIRYGALLQEKHQINAVAGAYLDSEKGNSKGFGAVGFPVGRYVTPSFANAYTPNGKPEYSKTIRRSSSFYLNGGYAFDNRYLVDFNIRSDGSSIFGSNKRFTSTWAVGLAWNIHREKFMSGLEEVFNIFKIRASVGNPGNQNFSSFQTFTTYRFDNWLLNGFGAGVIVDGFGNPDLKWQKTLDKNLGLDLSMFGNRFHVTLDWYHKNTDPLLAYIGIPSSIGLKQVLSNIGKQVERGLNGTIKYSPLYRPDERKNYTVSLNFRTSKAEYNGIGNKLDQFNSANKQTNSKNLSRYYDGGSPTALWSVRSAGIDPASGREIFIKKDGTYTFIYDYDDEVEIGDSRPKIEGVFGNMFYYKGFSCSLQLRYSFGAEVFNDALYSKVENISSESLKQNQDRRALSDRWQKAGDIAKYKDIAYTDYTQMSSRFVMKNNYLSIESVRVGYEFEGARIKHWGLSRLSVNGYMNDIARFSSIKSERGIDYPFARTLSLSISASF